MILPQEFEERMRALLGCEYDSFAAALTEGSATKGLFCTRKIQPQTLSGLAPFPLTPLPFTESGFLFDCDHIGRHALHHAGAIYVQDPSAQATAAAVRLKPGARVLDTCASPGGKTIALACAAGDGGLVVSNEIDRTRAKNLAQNVERTGLRNTIVTNLPTDVLGARYSAYFDLVVVDAPCSGEGMFRKYPSALAGWNPGMVRKCAGLQREILDNVCGTVAPGGMLLYSTCTFSPEEDEYQIEDFLCRHPDFSLLPTDAAIDGCTRPGITEKTRLARRFYPHVSCGEGQFIALLQRTDDAREARMPKSEAIPPTREELECLSDFLHRYTTLEPADFSFVRTPGGICALSCPHPYQKEGTIAHGVLFGSVEKHVFRPHHDLFSAYGGSFINKTDLRSDSAQIAAYLTGNTFSAPGLPDGWCCVLVDDCPLGGGKCVGGTVKNHYPKGLRNM